MLYFSHLNHRRCSIMESPNNPAQSNNTRRATILPDELLPFGLFLSQLVYSAGWFFPENRLPAWLQSLAAQFEGQDDTVQGLEDTGKRSHGWI